MKYRKFCGFEVVLRDSVYLCTFNILRTLVWICAQSFMNKFDPELPYSLQQKNVASLVTISTFEAVDLLCPNTPGRAGTN